MENSGIPRRTFMKYAAAGLVAIAAKHALNQLGYTNPNIPSVQARYPSTYRTPVILKDFKDADGNLTSVDVEKDFYNYEVWDRVNRYGNVSREVLDKKVKEEASLWGGRDYPRNMIVWRAEDFLSESLRPNLERGEGCYAFNFTYDPFRLMADDVSDQCWSEAITTSDFRDWNACLAYGRNIEKDFPDPYPIEINPRFRAQVTKTKYHQYDHAVLVIEQPLTNEPQKLPLPSTPIKNPCPTCKQLYTSEIPKICFNKDMPKVGVEIRALLNKVNKTRTDEDLTIALLNEIPTDYNWRKDAWPQDNTRPIEFADMELENKVYLPIETPTPTPTEKQPQTKPPEQASQPYYYYNNPNATQTPNLTVGGDSDKIVIDKNLAIGLGVVGLVGGTGAVCYKFGKRKTSKE